jgi:3-hydroxyacyl-[acyl-carrier-protein] dehydratase
MLMENQESRRVIGFTELKEKYLSHRYPILMIDRVVHYEEGEFIEAIKCVTGNSPELAGHFPERAIMPATSIIQAFAQLAIVFYKISKGFLKENETTLISSVKFRFLNPVFPGDVIRLLLKPARLEKTYGTFNCDARVADKSVVRGNLMLVKTELSKFENAPW